MKRFIQKFEENTTIRKASKLLFRFLSSKWFLRVILVITVLQGVWYAFSFQPTIYDEGQHIGIIQIYAERLNPFIDYQPPEWDVWGEVTRNGSYFFYYLMSFPFRFAEIFTDSLLSKIIFLRILNIALFAAAIVIFDKAFVKILKFPKIITRLAIAATILTPSIAMLPGSINYDNMMMLIAALLVYFSAKIITSKKLLPEHILWIIVLVCLGTVVKWQFVAFSVPVVLYLVFDILYNKKYQNILLKKNKQARLKLGILLCFTVLSIGLFLERPVYNLLKHGSVTVSCPVLLEDERCVENYTQERNLTLLEKKDPNFHSMSPVEYGMREWTKGMILTQTRVIPTHPGMPIMQIFYTLIVFVGIPFILLYIRDIWKSYKYVKFILFITVVYTATLFFKNYSLYEKYAFPIAVTSRYLLPVMIPFGIILGLALKKFFGKNIALAGVCIILLGIIFTQGGGITSYSITSEERLYTPNQSLQEFNNSFKSINKKFILEPGTPYIPTIY